MSCSACLSKSRKTTVGMNSVTKNHHFLNFLGLCIGLVLLVYLGGVLGPQVDTRALVAGYLLFGLNYLILSFIYGQLVRSSRRKETGGKGVILFATFMKFVFLIGALYIFLVKLKLSGFYLAGGSLGSLFVLTSLFMYSYLRTVGGTQEHT